MREPNTWLRAYAAGYGQRTRQERRAIYDFVMLWSVFEAQVLHCEANAPKMLKAIDHWSDAGLLANPIALQRMQEGWAHFKERLTLQGELSQRFKSLRIGQIHREMVTQALLCDDPEPVACHRALAIIIHRIRNNLLHGAKWSYSLHDQEGNFRNSSAILMVWMDFDQQSPFLPVE